MPQESPQISSKSGMLVANYELNNYSYEGFWKGREYEHIAEVLLLNRLFGGVNKDNLLDLGGAYGRLSVVYDTKYKKKWLGDYSTRELLAGKNRLNSSYEFVALNANYLPFNDNSFDDVLSVRLLHHINTPEIVFSEVFRVLKPGGKFILEFAHKNHILSIIKKLMKLNFKGITSDFQKVEHNPTDAQGHKEGQIPVMYSFNISFVKRLFKQVGFTDIRLYPCSFFRNRFLKKIIPIRILIKIEAILQRFPLFITPSIIITGIKDGGIADQIKVSYVCPSCKSNLSQNKNEYYCNSCKQEFKLINSIQDFRVPPAKSVNY